MHHSLSVLSYQNLASCIRILSADAVEKAKSGHPGMPLGMADVMTILATQHLRFIPRDPKWFNRDRLILSAGHGSMLLYSFLYLAGYSNISLEDIKSFRQLGSICAGHPEYGLHDAIETTTGPLGQGIANAVGMAIAGKKYQQKLGKDICDHRIYCIAGDGCLMEGISYEALSIAGHLKLDNLLIIFDDNKISIDGSTDLTISENHLEKFKAMGFYTTQANGHDYDEISKAFNNAKNSQKPSFISFRTEIGKGTNLKAGSENCHGSPLGQEEITYLKNRLNMPKEPFAIPEEYLNQWRIAYQRNSDEYERWINDFSSLNENLKHYTKKTELNIPIDLEFNTDEATRSSHGKIITHLMRNNDKLICGSADLSISNNLMNDQCKIITKDNFEGNFIHFGVRENAMAAICNGIELSGFNTICGTFFVFSDYMRPSIRLSAIMSLNILYIMTHDSIGVGEDGPTHQPVEHLASLRAMPNILIFRPADGIETYECYKEIAKNKGPSVLVLSRQKLPQLERKNIKIDISKGAYIISDTNSKNLDYTIFATGSEVQIALEIQQMMQMQKLHARVISVVCFDRLYNDAEHIEFLSGNAKQRIAIEAGSDLGWHKIITNQGLFYGINHFTASASSEILYNHFGLTAKHIFRKITIS